MHRCSCRQQRLYCRDSNDEFLSCTVCHERVRVRLHDLIRSGTYPVRTCGTVLSASFPCGIAGEFCAHFPRQIFVQIVCGQQLKYVRNVLGKIRILVHGSEHVVRYSCCTTGSCFRWYVATVASYCGTSISTTRSYRSVL